MKGNVVLLHGLWNPATVMSLLSRRLKRAGFSPHLFGYASVGGDLHENAAGLRDLLQGLVAPIHLVGFSLGGLVIRAYVHDFGAAALGRVVMLGTPNQGSALARKWAVFPPARWAMGRGIAMLNQGLAARWDWRGPELGLIAGSRGLLPGPVPHDGVVAVDEVWLPGAADRRVFAVSHLGLVFSPAVASATLRFLQSGRF